MGNEASQEVDIRVKYPRCRFNPPPQIGGSSYSYANAYSYSWRNCIKKSKQNDPPDSNQSVYVRTGADALEFTECGNEQTGGYRRCVAQKWAQKDDNTAKDFDEKQVEGEIQENGPVVADFMIRKDFVQHLHDQSDAVYEEDVHSPPKSRHTTSIVGFGRDKNGVSYWKCVDSYVDADGKPYEYKLKKGTVLYGFGAIDVKHPIDFKNEAKAHFIVGGSLPDNAGKPFQQFWNGSLPDNAGKPFQQRWNGSLPQNAGKPREQRWNGSLGD